MALQLSHCLIFSLFRPIHDYWDDKVSWTVLSLFVQLHGALCKQLHTAVVEVLDTIPALESVSIPGRSSGVLALSCLSISFDKAKNLLQYCSECSKLYLVYNFATSAFDISSLRSHKRWIHDFFLVLSFSHITGYILDT
jgi:hypothetical protein